MKYFLLLFILLKTHSSIAQHQERQVFFYNVGFGGFTSGIGALINKPKGNNWKHTFVKGFWQGSVGGLLNYASKKTLYLNNKNQSNDFSWPSKILHNASTSIMENAALNEPFLQNWNIDYGLLRFDFSLNKTKKFKARLLPEAIYAIIKVSRYGKFDFKNTLQTGNIVFSSDNLLILPNGNYETGLSYGRAIVFVDNFPNNINKYQLLAHEIIHQYQYGEYQIFNTWLKPLEKKVLSKTLQTIFTKYIYVDIPYIVLPYNLEGRYAYPHYFKNFYEFEAQRFSTNKFVER
jgi:hypothetical protein